jgi:hypothetical protein
VLNIVLNKREKIPPKIFKKKIYIYCFSLYGGLLWLVISSLQGILLTRGQFRGQPYDKPCDFSSLAASRATSMLKINVEDRFGLKLCFSLWFRGSS